MLNKIAYDFDHQLDELIINAQIPPCLAYYILINKTNQIYNVYLQSSIQEQHDIEQTAQETATEVTKQILQSQDDLNTSGQK